MGRKLLAASRAGNLKRVTVELGRKSPNIVFEGTEIEQAIKSAREAMADPAAAGSGHAGQMCSASSRIYLQEGVYNGFMQHTQF